MKLVTAVMTKTMKATAIMTRKEVVSADLAEAKAAVDAANEEVSADLDAGIALVTSNYSGIKAAITAKGVDMTGVIPSDYDTAITSIPGPSGNAVAADVLNGKTFSNDSGAATGTRPCATIPKTGQTTSYAAGDDGDIEAGYTCDGSRFTNNGDGTITDNNTGLMWTQSDDIAAGTATWANALSAANGLTTGGHTDWRLPNINEFQSIVNWGQAFNNLWLASFGFDNNGYNNYWTSTSYPSATTNAVYFNRIFGTTSAIAKTTALRVMAVRGGNV